MIDAKTAKELGLLNEVVSSDQLETQVKQLADELSSKPPIAIKLAKQLINNSMETNLRIGMMHESEAFGILGSTEDVKEGIGAFLEKRKPNFKGK
jgi:enoyl-CoA hydratase/carnithine racemase